MIDRPRVSLFYTEQYSLVELDVGFYCGMKSFYVNGDNALFFGPTVILCICGLWKYVICMLVLSDLYFLWNIIYYTLKPFNSIVPTKS